MRKGVFLFLALFLVFLCSTFTFAQEKNDILLQDDLQLDQGVQDENLVDPYEETIKAKVIEVLEEKEGKTEAGVDTIFQKLKLKGLGGDFKDKEFETIDEEDISLFTKSRYKAGDKVIVSHIKNIYGNDKFTVIDYYRLPSLYILAIVFVIVIVAINRFTGLRAILGLAFSIFIILKYIIPQIIDGKNPLLISILGSIIILIVCTYIIYGFNKKSHIAILSIFICLVIAGFLSVLFTNFANLTGFAEEETIHLVGFTGAEINVKGLLLAGILIALLGVIDDMVISQVSAVKEIRETGPNLRKLEVFKKAMRVGTDHTSSMVNTLFLVYAGASLSLLVLLAVSEGSNQTWQDVLNSEFLATEIVRTLIGSIALALSVPIATILAAYFYKIDKSKLVNK